jgi:hypothetical protein
MKSPHSRDPISGAQVRAARAFLGLTARALAKKAEVPEFTLEWIEGHGQIAGKDLKALAAIQAQLESAGIEFTEDDGIPGLRLHQKKRWLRTAYGLAGTLANLIIPNTHLSGEARRGCAARTEVFCLRSRREAT